MEKAKMKFVKFETSDVIATSGGGGTGFLLDKLGNGTAGDAIVKYNGTTIYKASDFTSGHAQSAFEACNTALGGALNGSNIETDLFYVDGKSYKFKTIFGTDDESYGDAASSGLKDLNGVWKWLEEYFILS